jgi:signal transduction histidine kinase
MPRVLLNLIAKGFYATAKRAQSQSDTSYEPTITATTRSLGYCVAIGIRDNGTGIPDDVKAKMFNPFFTTKPAGEGTGLGLSLSYDIVVKQHGGTLEVSTEPRSPASPSSCRALARPRLRMGVKVERLGSGGRRRARRRGSVSPTFPSRSALRAPTDGVCDVRGGCACAGCARDGKPAYPYPLRHQHAGHDRARKLPKVKASDPKCPLS